MTAWDPRPHEVVVFPLGPDPDRRYEVMAVDGDQVRLRTWDEDRGAWSGAVRDVAGLQSLGMLPVVLAIFAATPEPFAHRRGRRPAEPDVTDVTDAAVALTWPVTDVTDAVTPAVTGRACACGCGSPVISTHPQARYAGPACRKRANRRKRG